MLPEILARNLRVVFVGTIISELSDELGFYHLGANDRFWELLEYAGFTPSAVIPPSERKILLDVNQSGALNEIYKKFFFEKKESALLKQRVGLTVLNRRRVAGREDDPGAEPTIDDVKKFVQKMEKFKPMIIAFVSREESFSRSWNPLYPDLKGRRSGSGAHNRRCEEVRAEDGKVQTDDHRLCLQGGKLQPELESPLSFGEPAEGETGFLHRRFRNLAPGEHHRPRQGERCHGAAL